jgi:hypothetical protein
MGPVKNTFLLISIASALCLGADPQAGTWKAAQFDKWKTGSAESEAKKSHMFTVELVGKDAYRSAVTGLDGKTIVRAAETAVFDGSTKVTDAKTNRTSKHERIDAYHLRETFSSDKGTEVQDIVVSPDGKTLTMIRKGNSARTGMPVDEINIYEKQPDKSR